MVWFPLLFTVNCEQCKLYIANCCAIVFSQHCYVEGLIPHYLRIKEVIEVKWSHKDGHNLTGDFIRRGDTRYVSTEKRPCEETENTKGWTCGDLEGRQPSTSHGKRPQQKPNLLTPCSWTSSLQNSEKINFCSLGNAASGIYFIMVDLGTNIPILRN